MVSFRHLLAGMTGNEAAGISERLREFFPETSPERDNAIRLLAVKWHQIDPEAAMEWIASLEQDETFDALVALANELSGAEPVGALSIALALRGGDLRDDLLRRSIANWTVKDPSAAIKWVHELGESPERTLCLASLLPVWSETDPVGAANTAMQEMPDGKLFNDALLGIAKRWRTIDLVAVKKWVEQFPDGPIKDLAWEEISEPVNP